MAQQQCEITLTVLYDDEQHTPKEIEGMLLEQIRNSVNDGSVIGPEERARRKVSIIYQPPQM